MCCLLCSASYQGVTYLLVQNSQELEASSCSSSYFRYLPFLAQKPRCGNAREESNHSKREKGFIPTVVHGDARHAVSGKHSAEVARAVNQPGGSSAAVLSSEIQGYSAGQEGIRP